ncbi:Lin1244/Lin1753 domain-containing protein [Aliarcobacter butzleri]|uniref:Lin1244/Lin1753 domain-containing protein n=1 Tax=Aliarcobacter butzleri TaxID=28197 RepID=UPI00263D4ED1|nr:Lin1244/Lin1753 domain-containing protein [Aliarcobacter butzleri]MDN5059114.1 DUF4373 domain-containing protein [Aliarcobacter butzleri]MDN5129996.1 DUF4373 domain-containing protein [Aliarcobacter butzleri]
MSKTVPNFLFPTNFRNGKNIKRLIKDFNVQGYGIAVYLLETLAEAEGHKYPLSDIDLLADEMKVSVPVINTVITSYGLFELTENDDGIIFISAQLNKWLEPYYTQIEKVSKAGKIRAEKQRIKQEQEIKQLKLKLSEDGSSQHMLNTSSAINKLINKRINKTSLFSSNENEVEKFEEINQKMVNHQISKDKQKSKLEDLAQASKENEVLDYG